MKTKLPVLIISLSLPLLAGFIGSYFTTPAIPTWYASLTKPSFNPPAWLFAPVWTTLYLLMGLSLYLIIIKQSKKSKTKAYTLFTTQLLLNSLWSILFFGLQNPALALLEIIILLIFIALTIYEFSKLSRPAALLFIPYLLWVSFATLLNFMIYQLN
jgi:benzodiazapine receptor